MKVSFEGRPALDKLTQQLGHLFTSCYEPPLTVSNQGTLEHICEVSQNDPAMFANLKLYDHLAWSHSLHLESLSSHTATIEIYSRALEDPDGWGTPDASMKQNLHSDGLSPTLNTKSDWTTTLIVDAAEAHGSLSSDHSKDDMIPKAGSTDSERSDSSTDGNLTIAGSP